MAKLFDNRFKEVRTYRLEGETHRRRACFFTVLPQKKVEMSHECAKRGKARAPLWCADDQSRLWPNRCLTVRLDALL